MLVEKGKSFEVYDIVAFGGIAFGQNSHFTAYLTACTLDQKLQSPERFAGGNNIVNQKHPFALKLFSSFAVWRVSSAAITSALRSVSTARTVMSSRFPIGVATI